jgi:cobalamin biosynthesis protein CbiD
MKHIRDVLLNAMIGKETKVPLGRWNSIINKNKIDLQVMYSNEDHCGICNGYIDEINKNNKLKHEKILQENNYLDEYVWLLSTTPTTNKKN